MPEYLTGLRNYDVVMSMFLRYDFRALWARLKTTTVEALVTRVLRSLQ